MRRRVVVTGIGCVSPVGNNVRAAWSAIHLGRSGVGPITHFDATAFPTRIAAEVKNFNLSNDVPTDLLRLFGQTDRHIQYGAAAACQAVADSGIDYEALTNRDRLGVYLGSGEGIQNFNLMMQMIQAAQNSNHEFDLSLFSSLSRAHIDALTEYNKEPNVLAALIAGMFGAQGPNINTLTACAASAQAVGEATELIRRDDVDVMIVGGAHSMIHPFGLTGFCLLGALSTRNDDPTAASRPFDIGRDGFVLGEGAAMLILEEYSSARRRGARIYGEIVGYGVTADAYRLTDVLPDGNGLARAINLSLRDAGLSVDDIDYINAHGTSTNANDRAETRAVKHAFGTHAYEIPVSSIKSTSGHLVAACGAFEVLISLLALQDGIAPPTINYEDADPECDLDYVPNVSRELPLKTVMTNTCGFGGQNISLILRTI